MLLIEDLISDWKIILDIYKEIDPEQEKVWCDMAFGFALGRGASPKLATKFVLELWKLDLL